jgi:SAM-dependent methyltransferase
MIARRRCSVCATGAPAFAPLPQAYLEEWRRCGFPYTADDFETLNEREYACHVCGASDRDRLYALWIDRRSQHGGSLLDVGPSRPLESFLRLRFAYVNLDSANGADVVGDVQALPFDDGSFDRILCSHVLEHVADDRRALVELRRVLRPGGWGIVMAPICLAAPAIDEGPASGEAEAWRRFGQGDHVRLYNRDGFLQRLADAGFRTEQWQPGRLDRLRYGLGRGSTLYLVG